MKYKAQYLQGKRKLNLVEKERAKSLPEHAVCIKVIRAGICGSDVEYYRHGKCGHFEPKEALVLGHEFCGEIVEIGRKVQSRAVGEAVVVDPSMPCGFCAYCKRGDYNLCDHMKFIGSASCYPHQDGAFAEYVIMPEQNCLAFDRSELSWEHAALLEPLMVALSAVSKIQPVFFQNKVVAVFGGGSIGQLILAVLQNVPSLTTVLVEPQEKARAMAKARGAVHCYHPDELGDLGEMKFDVCLEASGNAQALRTCYMHSRKKGTIVQVGTIAEEVLLPANLIMTKELTLQGSLRYAHMFETAYRYLVHKKVEIEGIVTHTLALDQLEEGFQLILDPEVFTTKIQIAVQ